MPSPAKTGLAANLESVTTSLAAAGADFYRRGWVLGTSGNFSAVLSRDPLRIAVTVSGAAKGDLRSDQFVIIDAEGNVVGGNGRPSAETLLHTAIYKERAGAGAILHTHSIWATLLTGELVRERGILISGFEMLKGLSGVLGHEHEEWVPILENSQRYAELSKTVANLLMGSPGIHGILLARHGLYTWGRDIEEARRHIEILEFLFEVLGREGERRSPRDSTRRRELRNEESNGDSSDDKARYSRA
jgi:methylthioribulose-1-phosphate dehydratase